MMKCWRVYLRALMANGFAFDKESKGLHMLDTILVPLDGSQLSECVLPNIATIARAFDSEITLLRVLQKNQESASAKLFDLLNWQIKKAAAEHYIEKIKVQFQEAGLRAQTALLEGLVAEGITEFAQSQRSNLIILSSHGHSGLTQWGISSIAQKIILSAPTSVLIIRAHQYGAHPGELKNPSLFRHILIPLDGSQRAENVLPIITQLARMQKSQIHLVQIVQTPEMARQLPPAPEDVDLCSRFVERNQEEAEHYLEQMKSRSYLDGIEVQTHLVTSDNATVALHQLVEQENIDLVTLSAHGFSGNLQWPYGSLVSNFIMYGKVPLLIVQDLPAKQEPLSVEMLSRERADH